jgi:hypothetical protein
MISKMFTVLSALLVVCCVLIVPVKADFVINQMGPLNIVAGDSITQNITFRFQSSNGNLITGFSIMTLIIPDSQGINVTYSSLPAVIIPNSVYTIQMHIATSMLLIPGQYVITSAIHADQASPTPPRTIHASTGNQPPPNNNQTNPPPNNNTNDSLPPPYHYMEEVGSPPGFWIFVIIVIIALVTLLIFFIVRKRKKET